MAHPDWASKFKIKGTELRCINNRYYLYKISSTWDKEKKRARKITNEMIGCITESEGLIPKGIKKPTKMQKILQKSTTKEYGAVIALQKISTDIIESLKTAFPNCWKLLLIVALNRLLYQSPLKNMEFLYEESFISEQLPGLDLSKNAMTILMKELGNSKEQILDFLRKFVDGSEHLVFDTTHVISQSKGMELNQQGYNSQHNFDPQVNLFYMFSIDRQLPVYYRIFPGNIHGVSALKLCITEANAKKAIVVGDKGFCSENNINVLQESNLQYILPLKRDSSYINYDRLNHIDYEKAYDGHFFYNGRVIFYYILQIDSAKKAVVFCDKNLRLDEETSYLKRVEKNAMGTLLKIIKISN